MTNRVTTTGIKGNTYETLFRRQIKRVKPPAVGMAVAYVSVYGFNIVNPSLTCPRENFFTSDSYAA